MIHSIRMSAQVSERSFSYDSQPVRPNRGVRPVAIVGAGRSGTSMLARMLGYCGLSLGNDADFISADKHNPRGYWEHKGVFDLNQRLMLHLGSRWYDDPPKLDPGWQLSPSLDPFYEEAQKLVDASFGGDGGWVWKLPRASVTIPFWRRAVPDLRFVLCVRNPLDYAGSVERMRVVTGNSHAFAIWALYNMAVLTDTDPDDRFVTSFEEYFPDYRAGLMPVLDFIGIEAPAPDSEAARRIQEFHSPELRHLGSIDDCLARVGDAPKMVTDLYFLMMNSDRSARGVIEEAYNRETVHLLQTIVSAEVNAIWEMRERERVEAELDHLNQILNSRTHRAASSVCAAMIGIKSLAKPRSEPNPKLGLLRAPGDAQAAPTPACSGKHSVDAIDAAPEA
jgi:hypothetical protein